MVDGTVVAVPGAVVVVDPGALPAKVVSVGPSTTAAAFGNPDGRLVEPPSTSPAITIRSDTTTTPPTMAKPFPI